MQNETIFTIAADPLEKTRPNICPSSACTAKNNTQLCCPSCIIFAPFVFTIFGTFLVWIFVSRNDRRNKHPVVLNALERFFPFNLPIYRFEISIFPNNIKSFLFTDPSTTAAKRNHINTHTCACSRKETTATNDQSQNKSKGQETTHNRLLGCHCSVLLVIATLSALNCCSIFFVLCCVNSCW